MAARGGDAASFDGELLLLSGALLWLSSSSSQLIWPGSGAVLVVIHERRPTDCAPQQSRLAFCSSLRRFETAVKEAKG
jgi:hypothetical protein